MTTKGLLLTFLVCCTLAGISLQGCTERKATPKGEICEIKADTSIFLKEGDKQSPTCDVKIQFKHLQPVSAEDTLSRQINKQIQRVAFGSDYSELSPQEAVERKCQSYFSDYRKEVKSYYEAEIKSGMSYQDLPAWYNYTYEINTDLRIVQDSIVNFSVTHYDYTGGAHPSTFTTWTNFNILTGKILTKKEVFQENTDPKIIELIQKSLLTEANRRLETDTITSLQGLRENGVLLNVDLYVPENFLITAEGISFLFNRYDIAPYVVGDFQLDIPYTEIRNLMKMK